MYGVKGAGNDLIYSLPWLLPFASTAVTDWGGRRRKACSVFPVEDTVLSGFACSEEKEGGEQNKTRDQPKDSFYMKNSWDLMTFWAKSEEAGLFNSQQRATKCH